MKRLCSLLLSIVVTLSCASITAIASDDVNVIFVNPTDGKVKNDEFMFDNEWDTYDATFTTIDNETSQITSYFPIGTTFPHTVILDRNNIVREMVTAAMSYESLEAYYNQYK